MFLDKPTTVTFYKIVSLPEEKAIQALFDKLRFPGMAAVKPKSPKMGFVGRTPLENDYLFENLLHGDEVIQAGFLIGTRQASKTIVNAAVEQRILEWKAENATEIISRKQKKQIKEEVTEAYDEDAEVSIKHIPFVLDLENRVLMVGAADNGPLDTLTMFLAEHSIPVIPDFAIGAVSLLGKQIADYPSLRLTNSESVSEPTESLEEDFLNWLFFKAEDDPECGGWNIGIDGPIKMAQSGVMQGRQTVRVDKGLPTLSPEVGTGLKNGKKVTSARLSFGRGDDLFSFTLDSKVFSLRSIKLPDYDAVGAHERAEEKRQQLLLLREVLHLWFRYFLQFHDKLEPNIQHWVETRIYLGASSE